MKPCLKARHIQCGQAKHSSRSARGTRRDVNGSVCAFGGLGGRRRPWAPLAEQVGYLADAICSRFGLTTRLGAASCKERDLPSPALGTWQVPLLVPEADLHQPRSRHEVARALSCAWNTTPLYRRRAGGALARRAEWETGGFGDWERGRL